MLKHIAVRLKRFSDGEIAFSKHGRILKASKLEARDPALRNINDEMFHLGFDFEVDGCKLYWFQFDSEYAPEHYWEKNEVECVFESEWFEEQKRKIRYLSGVKYVEACVELAKQFPLKSQDRVVEYEVSAKCA